MKTEVKSVEDNRAEIVVTADAKEVDAKIAKVYKDFARKYNFPGFRKGKAPRPVIDNNMGREYVFATVTDELVNELYPLAVDECGYIPVASPKVEASEIVEQGKDYVFSFSFDAQPRLELSSYDTVEIELPSEEVTELEVEEQIGAIRHRFEETVDAADDAIIEEGGFADLTMEGYDDDGQAISILSATGRLYGLGMGLLPEEFDKELIGMKKGDKKEFSIAMPEVAPVMLVPLVEKTKNIKFVVSVDGVKATYLPELTDEWVKENIGMETVEAFTKMVRESLQLQKSDMMPRMKEKSILRVLAGRLEGEVPQAMVDEHEGQLLQEFFGQLQESGMTLDMYLMQQNLTPETFKEDVKKQAADLAREDLALDAWARHEEMTVSDEEVSAEFLKAGVDDPVAMEKEWRANGQLHMVRQGVLRARVVEKLMEEAKVSLIGEKPAAKDLAEEPAEEPAAEESAE